MRFILRQLSEDGRKRAKKGKGRKVDIEVAVVDEDDEVEV